MKRTLLVAAATVLATAAFSQVKYGVQVMGNASTASIKVQDVDNPNTKMQIGMGAGFIADYSVSEHFSVRGSLNWLQKKSKFEYETPELQGKAFTLNTTLNYLELPVHAVYKIPMSKAVVFAGIGPSFGYGISGKIKADGWMEIDGEGDEIVVVPVSGKIDAFKKEADDGAEMKRFDISASAIAGVAFNNGLFVHAGYAHGLSNLVKEDSYRNRSLLLTVGFTLP